MKRGNTGNPMVLCLDPSLTGWGFTLIAATTDEVIRAGVIRTIPMHKKLRTRVGDDRCRRISEIVNHFKGMFDQYDIQLILSEQPHGSQSSASAIMVGISLAVTQTMSVMLGVPIEWFSEQDAKKALLNKRSASKEEVIDAINRQYNVPFTGVKYHDEAVADAMAVYHVALRDCQILTYLRNN